MFQVGDIVEIDGEISANPRRWVIEAIRSSDKGWSADLVSLIGNGVKGKRRWNDYHHPQNLIKRGTWSENGVRFTA